MRTRILQVDPLGGDRRAIDEAAAVIRRGGLVAFPTETVYGLGANALDAAAARGIFEAKQRSPDDPCIVHVATPEEALALTTRPPAALEHLARAFWPGPLSLVLLRSARVPDVVTAGLPTVAVRLPDHPVALALIRAAGVPIAAPSANLFTHTSPTTAQHVWDDLAGRIDLVLDAGPTPIGVESTVLDLSGDVPTLLRPGGVGLEELRAVLGEVRTHEGVVAGPAPSPGLAARHYAPRAEVLLVEGELAAVGRAIEARARDLLAQGRRVGLLLLDETCPDLRLPGAELCRLGSRDDLETVARRLFAGLRALEAQGVEVILTQGLEAHGLGRAIQDRLVRAAAGRVVRA